MVVGRLRLSLARGRCQGEATGFRNPGNVNVEPLAWLELGPSVTVEAWEGRGRYVECVLLPQSEFEGLYSVIDWRDTIYGDREEAIATRFVRCAFFMTEACFGFGARLHHAAQ